MACNNKDFRARTNTDADYQRDTHLHATAGAVTVLQTHRPEIRWCQWYRYYLLIAARQSGSARYSISMTSVSLQKYTSTST